MTENKIKYNSYENSFYINDDEGISQIIAPELIIEIINDYENKIVKLIQENKELKKELGSFKPIIFETENGATTLYEKEDFE